MSARFVAKTGVIWARRSVGRHRKSRRWPQLAAPIQHDGRWGCISPIYSPLQDASGGRASPNCRPPSQGIHFGGPDVLSTWWTTGGRRSRSSLRSSRRTATGPMASGRASSLSWATATAATTMPTGRSNRCSRGRSSWPRAGDSVHLNGLQRKGETSCKESRN